MSAAGARAVADRRGARRRGRGHGRVVEEALRYDPPERGTPRRLPVAHPAALARARGRGPDGVDLNRTYPGRSMAARASALPRAVGQLDDARPTPAHLPLVEPPPARRRPTSSTPSATSAAATSRARLGLAVRRGLGLARGPARPGGPGARDPDRRARAVRPRTPHRRGSRLRPARGAGAAGWLGMVEPIPVPAATEVERRVVRATASGRVVQCVELGGEVAEGAVVAELRSINGNVNAALTTATAGWIGVHVTYGHVSPGDPVTIVFAAELTAALRCTLWRRRSRNRCIGLHKHASSRRDPVRAKLAPEAHKVRT